MGGYIFASVVVGVSWLFIASPFIIAAYGVYVLIMNAKAAKAAKAKKVSPAVAYLREARQMIQKARINRRLGYKYAELAAITAAKEFRKAAHAHWYYGE